ncbi:type II toxin-antitoxin system YoeB family toxin [Treponema primitia]|uniref:type II toxin-antitoxin system YoeB family toxin n=1 Tax=Treponema primitia TaxID=88058 RepID=UPI00025550A3
MISLFFLPEAWEDYIFWQGQDKKTVNKINHLLQEIDTGLISAAAHCRIKLHIFL